MHTIFIPVPSQNQHQMETHLKFLHLSARRLLLPAKQPQERKSKLKKTPAMDYESDLHYIR